jgi:hypothetical protein
LMRWRQGGGTRAAPKAQESLLCDLIISAFSALQAVAEPAPAVLVRSRSRPTFLHWRCQQSDDLRPGFAHSGQHGRVVVDRRVAMRMGVAGVALEGKNNRQMPPQQRSRLAEQVGGLQRRREVVEVGTAV